MKKWWGNIVQIFENLIYYEAWLYTYQTVLWGEKLITLNGIILIHSPEGNENSLLQGGSASKREASALKILHQEIRF